MLWLNNYSLIANKYFYFLIILLIMQLTHFYFLKQEKIEAQRNESFD